MYRFDYAMKMRRLREQFRGGKAVFTLPQMPIKCGGAPQKILYLSEQTFRQNKIRDLCDIHYFTSTPGMFPVKKYGQALGEIAANKNISCHLQHLIKSVDGKNRTVTFENLANGEIVESEFDLLHIVPP